MPIFLYMKLAGAAIVVAIVLYFVNDYRQLREFETEATLTIATKDLEIADKARRLTDAAEVMVEAKNRAETATAALQEARVDAVKADAELNITKLNRISEKTRFGKTDADGNSLLSSRMEKATDRLFTEIEDLTKVHGK